MNAKEYLIKREFAPTRPWFDTKNEYFNVKSEVIDEFAEIKSKEESKKYFDLHYRETTRADFLQEKLSEYKKEIEKLTEINTWQWNKFFDFWPGKSREQRRKIKELQSKLQECEETNKNLIDALEKAINRIVIISDNTSSTNNIVKHLEIILNNNKQK